MEFDINDFELNDFTPVDYDTLNSIFVGDAVISAAYDIWSTLGFLDGLDDEVAEKLAVAYDNLVYGFLSKDEDILEIKENTKDKFEADVAVYAILRIVMENVDNFNYKNFIKYMKVASTIEFDEDEVEELCDDVEREYCSIMADFIIRRFKWENK